MNISKPLVRAAQWLLGSVFLFSGLVKCIDPLGTSIKMGDYLRAMGIAGLDDLLVPASWVLCVGELLLGVYLFWGWKRRAVWWIATGVTLVFTGLTLWLALTDAVSDCGCFGDAVKLSNWATFWKNVVLLLLLILIGSGRSLMWSPALARFEFIQTAWTLLFALALCAVGTFCLPVVDFRPYRPGVNIAQAMGMSGAAEWEEIYNVIYEKEGRQVEFSLDSLPDETDGWVFVDQAVRKVPKRVDGGDPTLTEEPTIRDFFVLNGAGEDITSLFLQDTTYKFVLLSHDLGQADPSEGETIARIFDYAQQHDYGFSCMTVRDETAVRSWVESTQARYPFVFSDATIIETMGRANPTLMLLRDGTILWKKALPQVDVKGLCSVKLSEQSSGKIEGIDRKLRFFGLIICLFVPFIIYLLLKMGAFCFRRTN